MAHALIILAEILILTLYSLGFFKLAYTGVREVDKWFIFAPMGVSIAILGHTLRVMYDAYASNTDLDMDNMIFLLLVVLAASSTTAIMTLIWKNKVKKDKEADTEEIDNTEKA